LRLRQEQEWTNFRQWLRETDSMPDDAIKAELQAAGEKLARLVHGTTGSTARFLIVTAAGWIGLSKLAELGLGALDKFVVENVVKRPGPVTFLSRLHRSVFPDR
jgi:hypothetical protein